MEKKKEKGSLDPPFIFRISCGYVIPNYKSHHFETIGIRNGPK